MQEKSWTIRKDYDLETVDKLAASLGVDKIIAILLVERGVTTFEEARRFFRPSLEQVHDPFLMKGMREAIKRINVAIENQERIMVYGDYDVDGTSAVALVYSYFRELNRNIDFYVPDREREGYGISRQGVEYARDTGVKLVIALDCGIKAMEEVAYASQFGIDFIIGDHHLPDDNEVPAAVAVLDPKQADCPYPYKELSGCGIGFKIVEAHLEDRMGVRLCDMPEQLDSVRRHRQEELKLRLLPFLDLVAISIASDIVPIMGENRVLAYYGLRVLNTKPRPGIEAILHYGRVDRRKTDGENNDTNSQKSGYFEKELTISDLVFLVGPRINAAGRIRSAFDSVRLMITDDPAIARRLAEDINNYNLERKGLDTAATEKAKSLIEEDPFYKGRHSLVLYDPDWHRGVVGIVASRIVEAYYKPTIVFTSGTDGIITGSARSIKEFDVHQALEKCADLLEHFGGHRCAAGVSLREENMPEFLERFEQLVRDGMGPEEPKPEVEVDCELRLGEVTPKFLRILKQFAPFGPENNVPVFVSRELVDTGGARIVGSNHLKFCAIPTTERSAPYPAIAFQMGECLTRMRRGDRFSLCYQLEENYWKGKTEIQLGVKDIHFEG